MKRVIKLLNQIEVLVVIAAVAYIIFSWPVLTQTAGHMTWRLYIYIFLGWFGIIVGIWFLSQDSNGSNGQTANSAHKSAKEDSNV